MKRVLTYLAAAGMMIVVAGLMFSCTKEGPQGPAGAAGTNGTDGKDANATCTQCHNWSDTLVAKVFQYNASQHATGSTVHRNSTSCAPCHTSQGYAECVESGAWVTTATINDAVPVGCRTCHKIHRTYTKADWELTWETSFTNTLGGTTDMTTESGDVTGNLCARCHQSRLATPTITDPTSTTDSLTPTSKRYGPHHGPQSGMLAGTGGYDINGDGLLANSYHTGRTSCVDCHGREGVRDGGHTLWPNEAGCNIPACHDGAVDGFDYEGKQTIIHDNETELLNKLISAGVMDSSGYCIPNVAYSQKMLAVIYNFKFVEEDRSLGVHNFKLANGLLEDGIGYLITLGY